MAVAHLETGNDYCGRNRSMSASGPAMVVRVIRGRMHAQQAKGILLFDQRDRRMGRATDGVALWTGLPTGPQMGVVTDRAAL